MLGRLASILGGTFFAAVLFMCVIASCTQQPFAPRVTSYVTQKGECWVRPQGDPLYDAHYAQEVNGYNCDSYVVEAEGRQLNANARQTEVETTYGLTLGYGTLAVFACIFGLLAFAIIRG